MPKNTKEPEVIYREAADFNSPENQRKVEDAYDILFEEVFKRREEVEG